MPVPRMRKEQMIVGATYLVIVRGKRSEVRVDAIEERKQPGKRSKTVYHCTNMLTNRKLTYYQACKFQKWLYTRPPLPCYLCNGEGRRLPLHGKRLTWPEDGMVKCGRCKGTGRVERDKELADRKALGLPSPLV